MSSRVWSAIAACAAVAALAIGVVLGTYVAGGSDSSCYLNASRLLAGGRVALEQPLARDAPWPHATATFAPAGFRPSPVDAGFFVPICSPGLPLLMAAFRRLHLTEFLVVPLLGGLAVWLTYLLGRAIHRPVTGAAAAVLLVCSPTFLYQVVQPMSDVPAMAWWLLALVCTIEREDRSSRPGLAGLAASMALLTRPNLAPLAAVTAIYFAVCGPGNRFVSVLRFGAGLVPGVVLLAWLQRAMYGSPLATGYGSVGTIMAAGHVLPNLRRYVEWLIGAHTPFLLLALPAPAFVRHRRHAWLLLIVAATTLGCYLPYLVFDDWWYTRFLLPALPLLIVLSTLTLVTLVAGLVPRAHIALTGASVMMLAALWIPTARARHAFDLAEMEQHYFRAGTAAATHLTNTAAVVTLKDSGSVQFHAGRPTLSWDTLEPGSLNETLDFVRAQGYTPYLLLETDEEAAFRRRFGTASVLGNLDWPPRLQLGRAIRVYDPLDRTRYLKDGQVRTEFIRDSPLPSNDWRRWVGVH
jgi:hypothetical protein